MNSRERTKPRSARLSNAPARFQETDGHVERSNCAEDRSTHQRGQWLAARIVAQRPCPGSVHGSGGENPRWHGDNVPAIGGRTCAGWTRSERNSLVRKHPVLLSSRPHFPEDFPARLERFKDASGLSWRMIARAVYVSPRRIHYWRHGGVTGRRPFLSVIDVGGGTRPSGGAAGVTRFPAAPSLLATRDSPAL